MCMPKWAQLEQPLAQAHTAGQCTHPLATDKLEGNLRRTPAPVLLLRLRTRLVGEQRECRWFDHRPRADRPVGQDPAAEGVAKPGSRMAEIGRRRAGLGGSEAVTRKVATGCPLYVAMLLS